MKIKQLIILFATFIVLLGCNSRPGLEDRIVEEGDVIEYRGVIESLAINVYQQGTHQIRLADGEFIIIQSSTTDLNKYLDKEVSIKAFEAEQLGNEERVLNISEILLGSGEYSGELLEFENKVNGYNFLYPAIWELGGERGYLSLSSGENTWVEINIIHDQTDLDKYVASQELDSPAAVTIAAQRSLRIIDGPTIRVYVPNPPKKKVYRISFDDNGQKSELERDLFYNILESFELIYTTNLSKGDVCGGPLNTQCPEDEFCELLSDEKDSKGYCVPLDEVGSDTNCPFIAAPIECRDYRISEYSKNGCPTRYECVSDSEGLRSSADEPSVNTAGLIGTIEKYQNSILKVRNAEITEYEIAEAESLITVHYESGASSFKTVYSYSPSANEFNFIERAHYVDNILVSGEEPETSAKTIIGGDGKELTERVVSEDVAVYENTHRAFSLLYPKNWYYRSFGAINDTRWLVGFGDSEIDLLSDAVITVSILDEAPESSSLYTKVVDRNEDSVYVVEGPEDLKETVDEMAASIQ